MSSLRVDPEIKKKIDDFIKMWSGATSEMEWCIGGTRPPLFREVEEMGRRAVEIYSEIENYFKSRGVEVPDHLRTKYEDVKKVLKYATERRCW